MTTKKASFQTDEEMRESSFPLEWDNTMLVQGSACRRRLYWFLRGVDYRVKPVYFAWGAAWQAGIEAWYGSEGEMDERYEIARDAAFSVWEDTQGGKKDSKTSLERGLLYYAAEYPKELWKIQLLRGKSEFGFSFPLPETEFSLTGAVDGYIEWSPYGLLLLENKSTGMYFYETFHQQWGFSTQIAQYIWALKQILGETPFGALVNVVSKSVISTQKAWDLFRKTGSPPENAFSRHLEKRSEFSLLDFERDTRILLEDLHLEWDRWLWPKTRDHIQCVGGPGKSACMYRRLCLVDSYPWSIQDPTGPDLKWRDEPWKPWERGGIE